MSILHYVQCETCEKTHQFSTSYDIPDDWITIIMGHPVSHEGHHFCSEKCLAQWMYGNATQEESHKPPCKARRFLYVEDETGHKHEGILFSRGPVVIDFSQNANVLLPYLYPSWDNLIRDMADADRIEWIDQEGKV